MTWISVSKLVELWPLHLSTPCTLLEIVSYRLEFPKFQIFLKVLKNNTVSDFIFQVPPKLKAEILSQNHSYLENWWMQHSFLHKQIAYFVYLVKIRTFLGKLMSVSTSAEHWCLSKQARVGRSGWYGGAGLEATVLYRALSVTF